MMILPVQKGKEVKSMSMRCASHVHPLNPLHFVTGCPLSLEKETRDMSQEETPQALTQLTKEIRRIWHRGEWYYSVVDIIAVLTDSANPNTYWRVLKTRAKTEGFEETLAQIEQLRLKSPDGRFRLTDTANRQTLLRLIQSVPSPRAEPVRLWLAQVGEERILEIEHPEAALDRLRARLRAKGYEDAWIEERIKNDLIRNELTDEWRDRGAQEGIEFAILTNELSKGTFGVAVQAHKQYKLLPAKANLRDHMTPLELALSSLSEATAIELHRDRDSQGFPELKRDATDAGTTAGEARKVVEKTIGKPVVSRENYLHLEKGRRAGKRVDGPASPSSSMESQPLVPPTSGHEGEQPSLFDETETEE
jgi:DNA-damage-inducible protein D